MKGGNVYRAKGKHFTFTLLAVICMTIFLLSYEKKPLATTLFSYQDQLILPAPDVIQVASHISEDSTKSEDQRFRESPNLPEETQYKTEPQASVENAQETEDNSETRKTKVEDAGDEDKSQPHASSALNTKPVAEESSGALEDAMNSASSEAKDVIQVASHVSEDSTKSEDQRFRESPNVPEETQYKTEPQASVENAEETEHKSKTHKTKVEDAGDEDKSQPQASSALNTKPIAEESSGAVEDDMNSASSEAKACDYAKGRWVVDNRRPLYSGFKCKQWLSEMWACRLTQRPDFGYESYKWQPKDCDMPDFERSAFLKRMQDKTLAFVGDSLGRQQFQSLMCMVTGGELSHIQDVGREYGLTTPHGAVRPNGWAFRFPETNTTILYYWSSCLCDLVPLNPEDPQSQVAMHLDRPPSFLKHFLHHFDVLILNTGHHWNRGKVNANRWVMYIDGKPNENRRLAMIGNAKNFTIHSTAKWVDSQLPSHPRLKAFFRTLSPRHFFNGEWNTGGSCENTTPLARGSEVNQNESSDLVVASAVRGTRINLLDITALSQLRDEGHISRYSVKASSGIQDCLHWCLPGIPDTWNEILAAQV